jgi:predicted SprT family Zn-dependent metalloprotease
VLPIDTIYELYQTYNHQFFDGNLPKVAIEYSEALTKTAGLFVSSTPLIRLSVPLLQERQQETKDTLVHEMIHVAQYANGVDERPHGPYFSAQMQRINQVANGEVMVTVTHHFSEIETYEESSLLGKIKKLLALSESPNENEAYAAAQKVQQLMAANGIDHTDLKSVPAGSELDEPLVNEAIEEFGYRVTGWKFSLLSAICKVNYCKCLGGGQFGIRALGRKTHVEVCRSYYHYFVQVVESEAAKHRGKGKIYLNRFREAMVAQIEERLQQQFEQNNPTMVQKVDDNRTLTLISQYQTEVESFVQFVYPKASVGRRSACWADLNASRAGRKAGSKAQIAKHIVPESKRLAGHG